MEEPRRPGTPRRLRAVEAGSDQTVTEYLYSWLAGRRSLRESTVHSYRATIRRYLAPHMGDLPLSELRPSDIDAAYQRILESDPVSVSVSTLVRIHATLMSALNAAVRSGILTTNPATLVELPAVRHRARTTWSADQVRVFLEASACDPNFALYVVLALRGLRRGEALGLRVGDVDLGRGRLVAQRQVTQVGGQVVVMDPKSKAGVRVVMIDDHVCTALREHLRCRVMELRRDLLADDWVFGNGEDPLTPLDVTRSFRRLVEQSGLPIIRLHDLRHTSATLGLASGESLIEVSRRLGHSSVAITGDIYTDVPEPLARSSAQRMARLVWE